MERKTFLRAFLLLLLLAFEFNDVFTSETEEESPVEAEPTQEGSVIPDSQEQHQDPVLDSSCSCTEELKALRASLDGLQREFTFQKETEIHRQHSLEQRVQLIVQGIQNNQTDMVQMHTKYIQEHILDEDILQRMSESIWNTLQTSPNITSDGLYRFYTKLRRDSFPSLYLPFFHFWFNYLDDTEKLGDVQVLSLLMSELEITLMKSKPIQLAWWTKEIETFFLHRIHVNIFSLLSSSSDPSNAENPPVDSDPLTIPSVHDRGNFRSSDMTTAFSKLSKLEVYRVIVDTFESELAGELLSPKQLSYLVEKIYASSTTISRGNQQLYEVYSKEDWIVWKQIFGKKFVLDSIDRDILSKVLSNETDAATIGLKYIQGWGSFFEFHGNPEDDILFGHVAEVFLHAIQNSVMTYDPLSSSYWELIEKFQQVPEAITKYPFLVDDVKVAVFDKYKNTPQNFQQAVAFTKHLAPALKYPALKQLISSMREGQQLNGNLAFQVGKVLVDSSLHNDPIWTEIPEQVQLAMGFSSNELLWRVRAPQPSEESEYYEIVCNLDFSIGLYPLSGEEGGIAVQEDAHREWSFDVSMGSGPLRFSIQTAEIPFRGGVVLARAENGTQYARHVKNSRDRRNGMYILLEPSLSTSGDSFNLVSQVFDEKLELQVLYDEENVPFNLGLGNGKDVARIADFVVTKVA